jgi:hypothetical protein
MTPRAQAALLVPPLLLLGACSSLSSTVHDDVPQPHTLAVLPFAGDAPAPTRELARGLFAARLRELGYRLVEPAYVDRVLAENGWLADPDAFTASTLPLAAAIERLGCDGVLVADDLDESHYNLLLLRRQAVTGHLRILDRSGREWWTASHKVATTGGFLLQSGQVLTELRAQGMHGNSAATIALVDGLIEDVAGTLPRDERTAEPTAPGRPLQVGAVAVQRGGDGGTRLLVSATATEGASVWFDLGGDVVGVPMTGIGERFTGAIDVPAGVATATLRVRARDPFGGEQQAEVRQ